MQTTTTRHNRRENPRSMYQQETARGNPGATSNDSSPERKTRSRARVATKEEMLGDQVKATKLRKLLDVLNSLMQHDLIGVKAEYDLLMKNSKLDVNLEAEDRYFSPITRPTQVSPNDDYYKGKYRQLQKEKEQYQANETLLNTEIESLRMELEKKNSEIEHMKTEKQENYMSQNTSRDAQEIEALQRENDEMKRNVEETEKKFKQKEEEHMKWIMAMEEMKADIAKYKKLQTKNLQMEEEYKKRLKEEERKTKDAEEAKLQALTRLSREMGTKLNDNNPAIADLSDPNRATKLAEMYNEVYDNEWTDALEELTDICDYTEEIYIRKLLDIVKKAYEFCKEKAENQIRAIEDSFFMSNPDEDKLSCKNKTTIMKMLKDQRKSTAEKDAEKIYKEFSNRHYLKYRMQTEYAKKIVKLCWLMAVQDPPVCLGNEANAGDRLDTDIFKPYTHTGITVSYTVWLPIFLHEGGPLLSKGVAQPVSTRSKSAPTSRTNGNRYDKPEVKSRPTQERHTAAENNILQTKLYWQYPGETRRNQNYEMDFKYQNTATTKEYGARSYAPQPKVAWESSHDNHKYKYLDQYHNQLSESHNPYDTNRSQFNTGALTNSYRSPDMTYTDTQYKQSIVQTRTHRSGVHHKNFTHC